MLIKFFGGAGAGGGIASYLTDPTRAGREGCPPEVLRGDIERTVELIDSQNRKWTFTTGVISFALEDQPTEAQQTALMDDFERLAFAGLEPDQYDITWVRHSHTEGGRVELHFLIPRMELASGKAFNVAPPGWENSYAPLRDAYNHQFGWARPDDPARARTQQRASELSARADTRAAITEYLETRIVAGELQNRDDIAQALREAGYETPRLGKTYVTALDPETGKRWRLKGRIYEEDWTYDAELDRAIAGNGNPAARGDRGADTGRAAEARRELEAVIDRRAQWVRERYADQSRGDSERGDTQNTPDESRSGGDQRSPEADDLRERADHRSGDSPVLERAEAVDGVAAEPGARGDQQRGEVPDPARERTGWLELWRGFLREIGGVRDEQSDPDRTSALARIRGLGERVRDLGTSAVGTVRALFGGDRGDQRAPEEARNAIDASERSIAEAERLSERVDRTSAEIEREIVVRDRLTELERDFERARQPQIER